MPMTLPKSPCENIVSERGMAMARMPRGAEEEGRKEATKKKTIHSMYTREKDLQDITKKLSAYKAEANAFEQQTMNKKNQIAQLEKEIETEEHTANGAWQKWQQQEEVYKDLEYQLVS